MEDDALTHEQAVRADVQDASEEMYGLTTRLGAVDWKRVAQLAHEVEQAAVGAAA